MTKQWSWMAPAVAAMVLGISGAAHAAQLSTDARGAIPRDVQQLVVVDYRAMQNSPTAMALRDRVMPPDLKQFDEALRRSGLNDNHDVDQLAFALFRPSGSSEDVVTLGIAQGQFPLEDIMANFKKHSIKPKLVGTNKTYPMGKTGMVLCFVDASTMVFGGNDAVKASLDARDGNTRNLLTNSSIMDAMRSVDSGDLWSVLDQKGTQTMMKQVLGQAGSIADFESVQKRLQTSWYAMDFQHGVKFDLTIVTGDAFAAATVSSLLSAAVAYRKMTGDTTEKMAMSDTDVTSTSGQLTVHFASSDSDFATLLKSQLFQSVVQ
ncbi:MAG TPA: hypothetical protein VG267_07855 [Terracidiphilus sp.]|nr:hypothetical protein [Terracidiphilus sp.]